MSKAGVHRASIMWATSARITSRPVGVAVDKQGVVLVEPDLGTAASYVMLCGVVLWLSGVRARLFLIGLAGVVVAIVLLVVACLVGPGGYSVFARR